MTTVKRSGRPHTPVVSDQWSVISEHRKPASQRPSDLN